MDESVGKNLVSDEITRESAYARPRLQLCRERPTRVVEGNEQIEGNIDYARFSVSGKLDFLICTIDRRT